MYVSIGLGIASIIVGNKAAALCYTVDTGREKAKAVIGQPLFLNVNARSGLYEIRRLGVCGVKRESQGEHFKGSAYVVGVITC